MSDRVYHNHGKKAMKEQQESRLLQVQVVLILILLATVLYKWFE